MNNTNNAESFNQVMDCIEKSKGLNPIRKIDTTQEKKNGYTRMRLIINLDWNEKKQDIWVSNNVLYADAKIRWAIYNGEPVYYHLKRWYF